MTPLLHEQDLTLAALESPAQARLLETVQPPQVESGLAPSRVASSPADSLQELILRIEQEPVFEDILGDKLDPEVASVRRWGPDGGVFALSSLRAAIRLQGPYAEDSTPDDLAPQQPGQSWYIDARQQPVRALVIGEEHEYLLRFDGGAVALWAIDRPSSPQDASLLSSLQQFRPRTALPWDSPASLPIPAPEELLAGETAAPWLLERYRTLHASTLLLERIAALGLIHRLHRPASTQTNERISMRLSGQLPAYQERIEGWARSLPAQACQELERAALDLLDDLVDQLASNDVWEDKRAAMTLLQGRDDLASVAAVLRLAAAGKSLESALDSFDRDAETHLSAIESLALPDAWLAAVAWQEPMAWWAAAADLTP